MASFGRSPAEVHGTFQKSIQLARRSGFPQDAALACERAAEYQIAQEDLFWAEDHLNNALSLYDSWGATAKVNQLKEKYGHILTARLESSHGGSDTGARRSANKGNLFTLKGRSRESEIEQAHAAYTATIDKIVIQE